MGQVIQMVGWRGRQRAKARQGGVGINKAMFKPLGGSTEDRITELLMQSLLLTQLISRLGTVEEREKAAIESYEVRKRAIELADKSGIKIRWTGSNSFELIKIT